MTYTVNIPQDHTTVTDRAIEAYITTHPECSIDDAVDALFQLGVRIQLFMDEWQT
jgi:hypothetical protein